MGAIKDGGAALRTEFFKLMEIAKAERFEPWAVEDFSGTLQDFSFAEIMQYEGALAASRKDNFSEVLDAYFTQSAQLARVRQRASAMTKTVKTARDRFVRKLAAQQAELEKTAQRDSLRECGDIITANLHIINKGERVLVAEDFFSESGGVRTIELDPLLTPQQNAARYYKNYSKAKNAEKRLEEQIDSGKTELEYLESVLQEIELSENETDLSEIRGELSNTGYIRAKKQVKDKPAASSPMSFETSSGMKVCAGRNNVQNDKLTLKTAARTDVWLHAQKLHGAHVIISCNGTTPDKTSVFEAAQIAAYFSSARSGGKVPVDYTLVRYVKKPSGARPGKVIYTDYKTIIVPPDEGIVERLRR